MVRPAPCEHPFQARFSPSRAFLCLKFAIASFASETLASLNAMTTDLSFELEGSNRQKLLAAQQLIVLSELLVERILDSLPLTHNTQSCGQ